MPGRVLTPTAARYYLYYHYLVEPEIPAADGQPDLPHLPGPRRIRGSYLPDTADRLASCRLSEPLVGSDCPWTRCT